MFLYLLNVFLPFHLVSIAVWGGLSVFRQFVVLRYCGGSSLLMGLDEWLVKVSWLGKLFGVLVGGAGFLLSGVQ